MARVIEWPAQLRTTEPPGSRLGPFTPGVWRHVFPEWLVRVRTGMLGMWS
ncbi:hypothetical protein [Nocardia vaccinii]|nr:hypothetical protein [Nocardia vaccinii]